MSFASTLDLANLLGVSFNAAEESRAQLMLDIATATIQSYTGQQIELVEDDEVTLDPRDREVLLLPELPVVDVTTVEIDGDALVIADDVYHYPDGRLYRQDGTVWGSARQTVVVTYDHGYETIPDDIRGICLSIASRLYSNPQGLRQESIGTYSRTFGSGDVATDLSAGEKRILDAYRIRSIA